ncbi:hypothetical protein SAMN04489710_102383 [Paracidovorax konjaci]|uniref:Uncharacterized protein n=1 Tax=Paracidovorax konjaci TaxID=32040 RepID=A0A1I1T025_9BURK|nr:hypothetical protein SAMN04489710_102383 [Paracidovorax konjaci]
MPNLDLYAEFQISANDIYTQGEQILALHADPNAYLHSPALSTKKVAMR